MSTWEIIKQKKEQKAKVLTDLRSHVSDNGGAGKGETEVRYNKMHDEASQIDKDIKALEAVYDLDKSGSESRSNIGRENYGQPTKEETEQRHAKAFNTYIRNGEASLNDEQRGYLFNSEYRSLTVGSQGVVGTQGFAANLFQSTKAYSGPLNAGAFVYNVTTGNPFNVAVINDTAVSASGLAEGGTILNGPDPTLTTVTLTPTKYVSNWILVSNELAQDNGFDIESNIINTASIRIGRKFNKVATDYLVANTTVGATTAASGTIAYGDVVNFVHSLDWSYRQDKAKCVIELADATLANIRKLVDTAGRPIFTIGLGGNEAQPDTILGHPYVINNSLPSTGNQKIAAIIADHSKAYAVSHVSVPIIVRAVELFANTGMIGYNVQERLDIKQIDTLAAAALKLL